MANMAKPFFKLFIGLLAAALPLSAAPDAIAKTHAKTAPCSALKGTDGIRLHMVSDFYGDLDSIVSKAGMKFYSARSGVTVVALPPDGRMIAYNAESKKVYKVDMRRFSLHSKSVNVSYGSSKGCYHATGAKSKIAGVDAVEFANFKPSDLSILRSMRARALSVDGRSTAMVVPGEIWVTNDVVLPRTFMFIISKITQIAEKELEQMYGCTTAKMVKAPVPLRIFRVRDDGRKVLALDTRSATRQKVTEKDFLIPPGLRPVANEMALLMDDDGSFGFGGPEPDDLGARGKTSANSKDSRISSDAKITKNSKDLKDPKDPKDPRRPKRTMADLEKELGITPMAAPAASKPK